MVAGSTRKLMPVVWVVAILGTLCLGCHGPQITPYSPELPRELAKVPLPDYVIEAPDILLIDALRVVPLPGQEIQPLDRLLVQFPTDVAALNEKDLESLAKTGRIVGDIFPVEPDGTINLGARYGKVSVAGRVLDKAREAVETRLKEVTAKELVDLGKFAVSLAESRGGQQIRGEHLVRQDGKVTLGVYGSVRVAGMTVEDAKLAIEAHLAQFLLKPEVSVDVAGFNSKVYYVVTDGAGSGEQVARLPITGQETVLDALSRINGLPPVAAKNRIWIARPGPPGQGPDQILPVDWTAIVRSGATATNYQIFPGDRLYVCAQPMLTFDNYLGKFIAPIERVFGIILLGNSTVRSLKGTSGTSGSGTGG